METKCKNKWVLELKKMVTGQYNTLLYCLTSFNSESFVWCLVLPHGKSVSDFTERSCDRSVMVTASGTVE